MVQYRTYANDTAGNTGTSETVHFIFLYIKGSARLVIAGLVNCEIHTSDLERASNDWSLRSRVC
jgi:hypothetical protein